MTDDTDIVDLTMSFTLADHCNLANEVIVIDTDDSFDTSNECTKKTNKLNKSSKVRKSSAKKSVPSPNKSCDTKLNRKSNQIGDCPICWEELGKNPMASTNCGHVFCFKCIKQSLKIEKRCPNCRIVLKGASAYHRLYLSL